MDYQALLLIAVIIAALALATRLHSPAWPGRPGWQFQRVLSTGFAGLLFLVSGLLGWDLKYSHGWFQGTKWVDGPIWWEIGLGTGLLMLAIFWARRVPYPPAAIK